MRHALRITPCVLTPGFVCADRLNQRFVHLSESCIPLYPPALLYMQLLHEQKSRVHVQNPSRWDLSIATFTAPFGEPCHHSLGCCPACQKGHSVPRARAGSCSG